MVQWWANVVVGSWILFNILFNYFSCIFTAPVRDASPAPNDMRHSRKYRPRRLLCGIDALPLLTLCAVAPVLWRACRVPRQRCLWRKRRGCATQALASRARVQAASSQSTARHVRWGVHVSCAGAPLG